MKDILSYLAILSLIVVTIPATLSAQNGKLISEEKVAHHTCYGRNTKI